MPNTYSPNWFSTFSETISLAQTVREVDFVTRHLPLAGYPRILDFCCGYGRHAAALAVLGYGVTGIDANRAALARARELGPAATFIEADARDLADFTFELSPFNAVICLWQSFGFFTPAENERQLRDLVRLTTPNAALLLDVYHADFFAANQGTRTFPNPAHPTQSITESKVFAGGRLTVTLTYDDNSSPPDTFDWHLHTPATLCDLLVSTGWHPTLTCRNFDESLAPDPTTPRMQVLCRRSF